MMNKLTQVAIVLTAGILLANSANAQLFGSRSIKRSFNRQGSTGVGQVQGNERFVRGRRGRQNFIGADQNDLSGFVGNELGRTSGRIASPTGGMKKMVDKSNQINRLYPAIKESEIYPPVIVLPKALMQNAKSSLRVQEWTGSLTKELRRKVNDSLSVSVAGRSATLRGEVASANDRSLAELLIRFEPGIDEVQNEIAVANQ